MSKKNAIILTVLIIIFLIGVIIFFSLPKTQIRFATAPNQVDVLVNNDPKISIKDQDVISVKPGHYKITVSRNEFSSYTKEIDIKSGETKEFLVALNPLTENAKKLLQNERSQFIIENFSGSIKTEQTDQMTKNYPILKVLPIHARLYDVNVCDSVKYPNDPLKIALCIDYTPQNVDLKPYILDDIRSRGFNPDDYEIIYSTSS